MASAKTNIQRDWEQREFVEMVGTNVKKITEFLNRFGILQPAAPFLFRSHFPA